MIAQSPARIYKSHLRGHTEDRNQRLLATFNFGTYNDASRTPFGNLIVFNDETLAPQFSIERQIHSNTSALIIPLVGTLEYSINNVAAQALPGEAALIAHSGTLSIKNPHETGLINFLYVVFDASILQSGLMTINLDTKNTLNNILDNSGIQVCIGIFDARQETIYNLKNPDNGLFIFVISGAFEVQGRLLEERDGLALWQTPEAELEALSENAIVLLFEIPLTGLTA